MNGKPPAPKWLILLAFFNVYVIWGSTYVAVAFALKGFTPFVILSLRYLVAGSLLYLFCRIKGEPNPDALSVKRSALSGILMLVGGTGAIAWAEQYITSGQTAILIATVPLWFLLFDRKNWHIYFKSKLTISGLIIGFTGVYLFVKFGHITKIQSVMGLVATFVILLSAVLWVLGSLLSKRYQSRSSIVMISSSQLLAAGIFCSIVALFNGNWQQLKLAAVPAQAWLALLFLIVMGSLVAYLSFIWLIRHRPPALVSTHTYINPVVAVLLGWLVVGEQLDQGQLIGLAVILAGILLINLPEYLNTKS